MGSNYLNDSIPSSQGMVITTTSSKSEEYDIEYKNNSFNAGKKYGKSKKSDSCNKGKMTVPEAISILLGKVDLDKDKK